MFVVPSEVVRASQATVAALEVGAERAATATRTEAQYESAGDRERRTGFGTTRAGLGGAGSRNDWLVAPEEAGDCGHATTAITAAAIAAKATASARALVLTP
jgi:hypothetical protein